MTSSRPGTVIALSGWAGSGKDTAASFLQNKGYTRVAFADILKEYVAYTYGISLESMHSRELKDAPLLGYPLELQDIDTLPSEIQYYLHDYLKGGYWTPRALCILEGTVKRAVTRKYWTDRVIKEILTNADKEYVVTDLRYRSEATQLKERLGERLKVVRVVRWDSQPSSDPSETDLDQWHFDATLVNRGSIEDLGATIDVLFPG